MKTTRWVLGLIIVLVASCASGDRDRDSNPPADGDSDTDVDAEVHGDAGVDAHVDAHADADDDDDAEADADEPALAAEGVWYVGRYDDSVPGVVRFGWSGTGLIFRFRGTSASVEMSDPSGYFTLLVDGEEQPTLATTPGGRTYVLAAGLPAGDHTVELFRRAEGFFGPTVVSGVSTDGELLEVPLPARRMEVVGDSITCGYGNEGSDQNCGFSAATENHYRTYAAIAARRLGAELHAIAWSGKGMVFNYGDDVIEPMPEIYDRTIPSEPGSWSFDWQPDVVVINLGTNDFSTDGDPSEAQFVGAYVAFLERLRINYPDAVILCAVAPLLGGDDGAAAEAYVLSAVASRHDAGDPLVHWVDLSVEPIGWGCDWHPSVATHEAMADLLVAALETELGW